jgi:hypothetical protein
VYARDAAGTSRQVFAFGLYPLSNVGTDVVPALGAALTPAGFGALAAARHADAVLHVLRGD